MRRIVPLFLLLYFSRATAIGCSCGYRSECELAKSPVVFIGKAVAGGPTIRDDPWYKDTGSVRFEVVEAIRGIEPGSRFVEVETHLWPGMCSPNPYRVGRTYLVAPPPVDGRLTEGACFSGRDIEEVPETVAYLLRLKKHPSQPYLRGAVHTGDAWPAPKVLPGAIVSVTLGSGKTVSTVANARGFYELPIPAPGRYLVQASSPPYPTAKAEVEIPGDGLGCLIKELALLSASSISGQVRDSFGKALSAGSVGLIDLNQPPAGRPGAASHFRDTSIGSDGTFTFQDLPLGRYLLVFNPTGPTEPPYGVPFEPAFFPSGAASRTKARILNVDRPGLKLVHQDIAVPVSESTRFRKVTVRVRFPDGTPMKTAEVLVLAEPLAPGALPWIGGNLVRSTEDAPYSIRHARNFSQLYSAAREFLGLASVEATIQVPVNRNFRIVIRDAYRRDLGKAYESTHSAGTSPVSQDFRVDLP